MLPKDHFLFRLYRFHFPSPQEFQKIHLHQRLGFLVFHKDFEEVRFWVGIPFRVIKPHGYHRIS
jgi:hypothetical protein